jgi:phage terminase large subunit-like protein
LGGFPCGGHDDQVDASSGAFSMLTTAKDLEFLESTLILTEGDLNEL